MFKTNKKFLVIFLFSILFFSAPSAFAAYPSQCQTGLTNCTDANYTEILEKQCKPTNNPIYCTSMEAYLGHLSDECSRIKPSGFDCNMIAQGGIYGPEAAKYASYVESIPNYESPPGGNTSVAETTSGSGLRLPTEFNLPDPQGGIAQILTSALNWLLGIFGIIALIAFIISGLQYFFAAGDERTAETAKRNMTYSIIGVIIALSGFVIVRAVDYALRAYSVF